MDEYHPIFARRSYTRFKLDTQGKLHLEGESIHIGCYDVSGKGLGGISNKSLPINNKVKIEFFISWIKQPLIREGTIVWCKEIDKDCYRFGIEFERGESIP